MYMTSVLTFLKCICSTAQDENDLGSETLIHRENAFFSISTKNNNKCNNSVKTTDVLVSDDTIITQFHIKHLGISK